MSKIVFSDDPERIKTEQNCDIKVLLYGTRSQSSSGAAIGNLLKREIERLVAPASQIAFDFLTIAQAVTAADTFVSRDSAADRWAREFDLIIPVFNRDAWQNCKSDLQKGLHFLSGDIWNLSFEEDGPIVPRPSTRRGKKICLHESDCVSLFSGGLDSSIGVLDLLGQGMKPVLVSHSYAGDKKAQNKIYDLFGESLAHFAVALSPWSKTKKDTTMRTRSFNFLAYAAVVSSSLSVWKGGRSVDLFVPENGLIALNAPLTARRVGSLSTRTTHPYFLKLIQIIFDKVGIPAKITNPYEFRTKGEMIQNCNNPELLANVVSTTVSCGKWKRGWQQCGRCVPCLIRRASLHAAGMVDDYVYKSDDLEKVYAEPEERDDLLAMMLAVSRTENCSVEPWVSSSGPLSESIDERQEYYDVFRRGLLEVGSFLRSQGLSV